MLLQGIELVKGHARFVERKTLAVVPNCGHMMPLECGPQSAQRVVEFLAATPR